MPADTMSNAPTSVVPTGDESADPEPSGRWQLTIDIVDDEGDWQAFGPVAAHVDRVVTALSNRREVAGQPAALATIVLSSNAAVRKLNKAYRGKDAPTNVLSFPAPAMPVATDDGPRLLGDVVLAEETLLSEAADIGIPPVDHLMHLVLHGLLHLAGYDHETDGDAMVMERLETAVLADLGVPDPYAPSSENEDL